MVQRPDTDEHSLFDALTSIEKNKQQPLPVHQNPVRTLLSLGLTSNHPCLVTKTRQEHNPYMFTKTR
ncbi:hypothetical protein DEO72_LG7g2204 [Vigna unguiculata]|uniref:Uncharacterized protein n=1 Tax=Vigna unguiculata TaxID=3917 RepID=A0A4D6MHJ9_VIGUN|nr:hypothetical protein DEO72_LG7g2204 [Vigna unguiculata]